MTQTGKAVLVAVVFSVALVPVFSQKPSFDVVSIKPSGPNPPQNRGGGARGNRYTLSYAPLRSLLLGAYQQASSPGKPIAALQIIGGPSWIDSERYDIQATMDCSNGPISREQFQIMMQSMLADRFQLKAHMEDRELPIYTLVVGKDGPKIKPSADQTPTAQQATPTPYCGPAPSTPNPFGPNANPRDPNFIMPRGMLVAMGGPNGSTIRGAAIPLPNLLLMLQFQIGRPVVDKTDLKGLFDFTLQIGQGAAEPTTSLAPGPATAGGTAGAVAPPAAADPGSSIFTAFQELGLKLESAKGPVPVVIIDSVQKPKEN